MLSIVTALYKSDRYLPGYFKRLYPFVEELQKKGVPFEVIFVPQHSTDFEKKLLAEAAKNSWCRVIENETPSLYMAWNTGVLNAKGEAVCFWNADDWRYAEGTLEAYEAIQKGADVAYSPFRIRRYLHVFGHDVLVHIQRIDRQVPEYTEQTRPDFLFNMHCGPFFLFSRKFFETVGPFDEQFKTVADFEWCVRAAKLSAKFHRCKKLIGSFRVDGRGVSAGGKPKHMAENNIVYIRHNQLGHTKLWPNTEEYMKAYDTKKISFRGKTFMVNEQGLLPEGIWK
jgi:GT2 family glycosyltransferase